MISYAESSLLDERGLTGANISRINGVVDNAGEPGTGTVEFGIVRLAN